MPGCKDTGICSGGERVAECAEGGIDRDHGQERGRKETRSRDASRAGTLRPRAQTTQAVGTPYVLMANLQSPTGSIQGQTLPDIACTWVQRSRGLSQCLRDRLQQQRRQKAWKLSMQTRHPAILLVPQIPPSVSPCVIHAVPKSMRWRKARRPFRTLVTMVGAPAPPPPEVVAGSG